VRSSVVGISLLLAGCYTIHTPTEQQYNRGGVQIAFISKAGVSGGARAGYNREGIPVVEYDPSFVGKFPEEMQSFIFHHEIGHIILGHNATENSLLSEKEVNSIEQQADCYSIRVLEEGLKYNFAQIEKVYHYVSIYFDQKRADNLLRCISPNNH